MASITSFNSTSLRNSSTGFIFLLVCIQLQAQIITISPYSKAGIGEIQEPTYSRNFAMGRLAYGMNNMENINPFNPASYAGLNWTAFEVGVISNNSWLTSGSQSQRSSLTHFNHLAMAFPITQWWGASFGMMPVSTVGYDYRTNEALVLNDSSLIPYQKVYSGAGGLNKFYIGNGFRLKKKLYLGFNVSYIFGDMEHQEIIAFTETDNFHNSASFKRIESGDFHIDFGAQYAMVLKNNWKAVVGLIFEPAQGLLSKQSDFQFNYLGTSGLVSVIDTSYFKDRTSFSIDLPMKFGFGAMMIKSDRIQVGFDIDYTAWSVTRYNTFTGLDDSYNLKVGGEFVPESKKIKLRLGARYGKNPMVVSVKAVNEMAVSAGLAFPFRTKDKLTLAELNLGVELGRRGKDESPLLQEDFINVHVGLTLNNKWFIKRKYD